MLWGALATLKDLIFDPRRAVALLLIVILCSTLAFCEGMKRADRSREISQLRATIVAYKWAQDQTARISRDLDLAAKREIANREEAEKASVALLAEADEWERKYVEADRALREVKCPTLVAAEPPPPLRCPDPFYSGRELDRLCAAYPQGRCPRHPRGPR